MIDQGAIVENKRLGQTLRIARIVQSERDSRAADVPSTAHRSNGSRVPRKKIVGAKTQRQLSTQDLHRAIGSATGAKNAPRQRLATPA
jgi:hypothetical protein